MPSDPSYPEDTPVGQPAAEADGESGASKKADGANRTRKIVTGTAIGIGSAALVAALLYANRSRKGGKS